jgi:CheY-like chemotaxis protein
MAHSGLNLLRPVEAAGKAAAERLCVRAPRILLVEDDDAVRESLSELLRDEGFEVVTARNGREALEHLRAGRRPTAILLDLMMPVMDGWDFRQHQLRDPALRDIPVVVVTATGFSAETIRTQFGSVDTLPKPVPYLELLDVLGRANGRTASAA